MESCRLMETNIYDLSQCRVWDSKGPKMYIALLSYEESDGHHHMFRLEKGIFWWTLIRSTRDSIPLGHCPIKLIQPARLNGGHLNSVV